MVVYIAKSAKSNTVSHLSESSQMDRYLKLGCCIYSYDTETEEETMIASPENGYLVKKPIFPETYTMKLR